MPCSLFRARSPVDPRQGAVTVAHHDLTGAWVEAHVVGVVAELGDAEQRQVGTGVALQGAVAGAGDVDGVQFGRVADALRLLEAADPVDDLALRQVDDAQAAVAELGNEQTLAGKVHRQMVDAALHRAQGDLALQRKRAAGCRCR